MNNIDVQCAHARSSSFKMSIWTKQVVVYATVPAFRDVIDVPLVVRKAKRSREEVKLMKVYDILNGES